MGQHARRMHSSTTCAQLRRLTPQSPRTPPHPLASCALAAQDPDQPQLILIECKRSTEATTAHQAQLAAYRLLLAQLLRSAAAVRGAPQPFSAGRVRCVLATAAAGSHPAASAAGSADAVASWLADNELQPQLLDSLERDLLTHLGGSVRRALAGGVHSAPFTLGAHCTGCPAKVAAACLSGCAERGALQLAGADAATAAQLAQGGVQDIEQLCSSGEPAEQLPASLAARLPQLRQAAQLRRQQRQQGGSRSRAPSAAAARPEAELRLGDEPRVTSVVPVYTSGWAVFASLEYDQVSQRIAALGAHVRPAAPRNSEGGEGALAPLQLQPAKSGRAQQHICCWSFSRGDVSTTAVLVQRPYTTPSWLSSSEGVPASEPVAADGQSDDDDDVVEAALITRWAQAWLSRIEWLPQVLHLYAASQQQVAKLVARCRALLAGMQATSSSQQARTLELVVRLLTSHPGVAGEQQMCSALQEELKR